MVLTRFRSLRGWRRWRRGGGTRAAIEITPGHPGANELLAHVRIAQGDDSEGAANQLALGTALARETADNYPAERHHLVGLLIDIEAADEFISVALDSGLRDADLFFHAGRIAAAVGDNGRADSLLRAAATLNPTLARLVEQP